MPAFAGFNRSMAEWGETNPLTTGDWSNALGLIPFIVLVALLYAVGREWLLAPRGRAADG